MSRVQIWRSAALAASCALIIGVTAPHMTAQGAKQPDTIILTGAPTGGVKLNHKAHAVTHKIECVTCHHASKPEKPLKSKEQKCTDCHTKTATPPMKTTVKLAFHDAMAKKGTCVDCHLKEKAAGKTKVPVKCAECHKKENV
jgi:hypothetical protein